MNWESFALGFAIGSGLAFGWARVLVRRERRLWIVKSAKSVANLIQLQSSVKKAKGR